MFVVTDKGEAYLARLSYRSEPFSSSTPDKKAYADFKMLFTLKEMGSAETETELLEEYKHTGAPEGKEAGPEEMAHARGSLRGLFEAGYIDQV